MIRHTKKLSNPDSRIIMKFLDVSPALFKLWSDRYIWSISPVLMTLFENTIRSQGAALSFFHPRSQRPTLRNTWKQVIEPIWLASWDRDFRFSSSKNPQILVLISVTAFFRKRSAVSLGRGLLCVLIHCNVLATSLIQTALVPQVWSWEKVSPMEVG